METARSGLAEITRDTSQNDAVVAFSGVRFRWPGRVRFSLAIDAFQLKRGERVLLIGPSGSGKSTFLSLLAGIVVPDAGAIEILGTDTAQLSRSTRDRFRAQHFGIIFQMFNLLPYGSLIDNVCLPLRFSPARLSRAASDAPIEEVAARLLAALGLDQSLIQSSAAANLSVGQQQRVAAARALIGGPEIIVADEPTSALDRNAQGTFLRLLFEEAGKAGASVVMVSHDESLDRFFDRVVRLDDIATVTREAAP